jgi:hypothetical protein
MNEAYVTAFILVVIAIGALIGGWIYTKGD